jgi:hypothetical protein
VTAQLQVAGSKALCSAISKIRSSKPRLPYAPFVVIQMIPLLTLPIWFFFFLFFDTGARPVAERCVHVVIYLLFGSQWFVPLFFLVGSSAMWAAVMLRLKRLAWSAGIALCLPLTAILIILLLQYRASVS